MDANTTARPTISDEKVILLPAPTAWPIVLAFGITLLFAGLVTSATISFLGAFLALAGSIGWFRDVLPVEKEESVTAIELPTPVVTSRKEVAHIQLAELQLDRARLPLAIYPVSAGVKGGMVGAVVMAILAIAYGVITKHGVWYTINLLSAGFFPGRNTTAELVQFHLDGFIVAAILHLFVSFVAGLLYGAALPMIPRHPILLGGLVAPILWSGLLHGSLGLIDPVLNDRIDWGWFVVSQIGFGLAAGLVVSRQEQIRTWQHLPFMIRAGMKGPEGKTNDSGGSKPQ